MVDLYSITEDMFLRDALSAEQGIMDRLVSILEGARCQQLRSLILQLLTENQQLELRIIQGPVPRLQQPCAYATVGEVEDAITTLQAGKNCL